MGNVDQSPSGADFEERLRTASHDLRHCLYVLQQGIELLQAFREDVPQFERVAGLLKQEHAQACKLIEELTALARSRHADQEPG
jgi:hypothetical protein